MADKDPGSTVKAGRSPNFPYINLSVALERAKQLYETSKGNSVRFSDAAADWRLSATSSGTQRVVAALLSFGLLVDEGSGDDRRLKLSQSALRILSDSRPGIKEELLQEAALRPQVLRDYYTKWRHNRPSDNHAISQLTFDSGFNADAARMFLRVYDDALSYLDKGATEEATEAYHSDTAVERPLPVEQERASFAPSVDLAAQSKFIPAADEWLKVRVGKETSVTIIVDGQFGLGELTRLIRLLEAQRDVMDEDF